GEFAPAALSSGAALLALLRATLFGLGAGGLSLGSLGSLGSLRLLARLGYRGGPGLLAALAAARPAPALGLRACIGLRAGRLGSGRCLTYFGRRSGGLGRRLLPLRLAPAEPLERQRKSSRRLRA